MIIKCPTCDGALEFDVQSGLMYCKFCGSFFTAEEVAMPETDPADSAWSPSTMEQNTEGTVPQTIGTGLKPKGYGSSEPQPSNQSSFSGTQTTAGALSAVQGGNATPQPAISHEGFWFAPSEERPKYDSYEDLQEDAENNRYNGKTGDLNYMTDPLEKQRKINEFYAEQQRLHEEYMNRPKADYTKPFAGMSNSVREPNLPSGPERMQYYADQARISEEYNRNKKQIDYSKPFAGTSRENMTMDEIVRANLADSRARDRMRAEMNRQEKLMGAGSGLGYANYSSALNSIAREYENKVRWDAANSGVPLPVESRPATAEDMVAKTEAAENGNNAGTGAQRQYAYTPSGSRILSNSGGAYIVTDAPVDVGAEQMDNKVYTCTSCGAELGLTGVETSSFCAYCGQPTIVFSRMEKCTKPDYIIPFSVTRDQALKLVKNRLNSGLMIPKEVKEIQVEKTCGIYIPYWLFDASYSDSMVIRTRVKQGKTTTTKYYRVNCCCNLFYFPMDASRNLNDNSSKKLDPYDYSGIRPFHPSYMSGFYSDRFDMSSDTMTVNATYRAQSMMYEKAKKKVPGSPQGMDSGAPMFHVKKKYYTMLPAWFLSFKHEGITYTVMVNGQTGKVAGAVPYDNRKFNIFMTACFLGISAVVTPLSVWMAQALFSSSSGNSNSIKALFIPFFVGGAAFAFAQAKYRKFQRNMELAREEKMTKFVKERQEV